MYTSRSYLGFQNPDEINLITRLHVRIVISIRVEGSDCTGYQCVELMFENIDISTRSKIYRNYKTNWYTNG